MATWVPKPNVVLVYPVASSGAAASVGVTALTAHSQTVEGDAETAAQAIAKQLAKSFFQQGWIPPGQGE
jgi:hypothetical protein